MASHHFGDPFMESLERLLSPEMTGSLTIVVLFVLVLLVALSVIVARTAVKIRRDAVAAALKRDMLDRGMSAEEIKTVLEAGERK